MPFSIFTRNIAVFTFHSTWPHPAEVESDPVSPSQVKVGFDEKDRWVFKKDKTYSNRMPAHMDQFELAKIPLQQAGVDERLHLK